MSTPRSREPVQIVGGSGPDPLAREVGEARATDRRRQDVKRALVLPEHELGLPTGSLKLVDCEKSRAATVPSTTGAFSTNQSSVVQHSTNQTSMNPGSTNGNTAEACAILVPEHELVAVEDKRNQLKKRRLCLLEACSKVIHSGRGGATRALQGATANGNGHLQILAEF